MTKHRAPRTSRRHPGVRLVDLGGGRILAKWDDPDRRGKQQQVTLRTLGLTTQRQREQWAIAKSKELHAIKLARSLAHSTPEPMTVDEGLSAYGQAKPIAERTALARKIPLDDFAEFCRGQRIQRMDQLTAPKLWPWRDRVIADDSRMESTRNLWLAAVAAFLRWAITRDLVPLLPAEKVAALTKRMDEPEREIEFLKPAEVRKVLEAAIASDAKQIRQRRPVAGFIMTTLLTGARFAEVSGLDWSEVEDEGIKLPAHRVKNRRSRLVSFQESPTLKQLLVALRRGRQEGLVFDPLWHPQVWRQHQKRVVKESGVAFTPRSLRRTCGTVLANAAGIAGAASIWWAAKRLGHTAQIAERHYADALPGLPADAKTIEDAVGIRDLCEVIVESARG